MNEPCNQAAWIHAKRQPFSISSAPMPSPGPNELLIRNRAVALNPFDGVVQSLGSLFTPWLTYPAILGSDVAGEVIAAGTDVARFKVGDRVLGLALGVDKLANRAAEGAFQHYVILREAATTRIPDTVSYEQAAVLPLAIATAACGLFLEDQLGLQLPNPGKPVANGQAVLIWGGSTSVGSCAIQLAAAAGYRVVTTTSPKNFDYVRALGATHAIDYRDVNAVTLLEKLLHGQEVGGALAIPAGSGAVCVEIMARCKGPRLVSMASAPISIDNAPLERQFGWRLSHLPRLAMGLLGLFIRARLRRVKVQSIWGTALLKGPLGRAVFEDYLGPALASGDFIPAPPPRVVGHSLHAIPQALTLLKQGVSASKLVVSL